MSVQRIRLGHSPDPDDAFMFYGLATGMVDSGPFVFEHILRDIQTLNDWAMQGKLEVTAISVHAYAYVQAQYAILNSGASMGATGLVPYGSGVSSVPSNFCSANPAGPHGPLLVACKAMPLSEVACKTIAIPGTLTSAFLVLQLVLGDVDYLVMKFDEIPEAVVQGKVDAGLIIHESQLTFHRQGLHCLLDLGQWWHEETSLPMPLGCNVIRRDLGPAVQSISKILKASIAYSLSHRQEAIEYAQQFGQELDTTTTNQFIGMYVNDWTLDYSPVGRQAVVEILKRGHSAGIIPPVEKIEFI